MANRSDPLTTPIPKAPQGAPPSTTLEGAPGRHIWIHKQTRETAPRQEPSTERTMATQAKETAAEEKLSFQADVSKLLHIVANSLYSEKDVFLRELVSNASDACDKLRYEALTEPGLVAGDAEFKVELYVDKRAKTLTIADNGIGMSRKNLIEDLGTIARSGTNAFLDNLSESDGDPVSLIGQFGVGFYSAFMVADKVTVVSRRAGEDSAWTWDSDGKGEFTVAPGERGLPVGRFGVILGLAGVAEGRARGDAGGNDHGLRDDQRDAGVAEYRRPGRRHRPDRAPGTACGPGPSRCPDGASSAVLPGPEADP